MKVRALCAAGLVAIAALPATAAASNSIKNRLHRANVSLNKAQDASDNGNDAGVVAGLKGAVRQTKLAQTAASRLVKNDRDNADVALSGVTDQQDANAQAAMDLLDSASATVVASVNTTLAATDSGRGQVLTLIQGLGDNEGDWGDALTQIADDAASEIADAADNFSSDTLSSAAETTLTDYVSHETDAAAAIVQELVSVGAQPDAGLDGDALDGLEGDVSDASDALDSVTGLATANATAVAAASTKLGTIDDAVSALSDAVNSADDYADDSGYDDSGYGSWTPPGGGYGSWNDNGYRHGRG
ncbi:MAG: hypothetical protein JWM71_1393 [Solirubrobacteraceae bacterium]|nr:hypothetical protein [Solirubrobacteraceae bacterium]